MAKIRFTKNELKKQKDSLKRFNRYLPTLKLKKKQLQSEIIKVQQAIEELEDKISAFEKKVFAWVDVFSEAWTKEVDFSRLLKIKDIKADTGNIAGIDIPVFAGIEFAQEQYDLLITPLWVDTAIDVCKESITLKARLEIAKKQKNILREELRIAIQRVNLFEKVKIPQASENIRVINIYLGDLQTAEVIRGKIAKEKIERKKELALL